MMYANQNGIENTLLNKIATSLSPGPRVCMAALLLTLGLLRMIIIGHHVG